MWYLQTMVYYSALKRKEILTHVPTGMKLEDIILNEISQSQEGKYCIIPLRGDDYSSQNHRDRKKNGGRQGLEGGGWELVFNEYRASVLQDEESSGDGWW